MIAACSPVLLPARVVQALHLNVHALGLQVSPCPGLQFEMLLLIILRTYIVFFYLAARTYIVLILAINRV